MQHRHFYVVTKDSMNELGWDLASHKFPMRTSHSISLAGWIGRDVRCRKTVEGRNRKCEGREIDFSGRTQPQPRLIRVLPIITKKLEDLSPAGGSHTCWERIIYLPISLMSPSP